MKSQLSVDATDIELIKQPDGSYRGTVTAANGYLYDVVTTRSEAGKIEWKANLNEKFVDVEVERMTKNFLEKEFESSVESFELKKTELKTYTGTAMLENGRDYELTVEGDAQQISVNAQAGPVFVKQALRDDFADEWSAFKLDKLDLTRKGPGEYEGAAITKTGKRIPVKTWLEETSLRWRWTPPGVEENAADQTEENL